MAEEPKETKAEEAPKAAAPVEGASDKRKKVNQFTLAEVEEALKTVKEKMGGFNSGYAHSLLTRKKELTSR